MYNSQIVYDRIKNLLDQEGKSMGQLNRECNISGNTVSQSATSGEGMKARRLYDIANFLDCSLDYLFGRTENPHAHIQNVEMISNAPIHGNYNMNAGSISVSTSELNEYQSELIRLFEQLKPIQQAKLLALVSDVVEGKSNI